MQSEIEAGIDICDDNEDRVLDGEMKEGICDIADKGREFEEDKRGDENEFGEKDEMDWEEKAEDFVGNEDKEELFDEVDDLLDKAEEMCGDFKEEFKKKKQDLSSVLASALEDMSEGRNLSVKLQGLPRPGPKVVEAFRKIKKQAMEIVNETMAKAEGGEFDVRDALKNISRLFLNLESDVCPKGDFLAQMKPDLKLLNQFFMYFTSNDGSNREKASCAAQNMVYNMDNDMAEFYGNKDWEEFKKSK